MIKDARSLALTYDCHITRGGERWAVTSNRVVLRHAEQQRMDL